MSAQLAVQLLGSSVNGLGELAWSVMAAEPPVAHDRALLLPPAATAGWPTAASLPVLAEPPFVAIAFAASQQTRAVCRKLTWRLGFVEALDARDARRRPVASMRLRRDPLPRMLILDLVAVARMLFRTWRANKAPQHKLRQLTEVGRKLQQALELAKMPVATTEHAEAWRLAEEATEDLGRLVGSEERTLTLVTAVFRGLERPQLPSIYQEREAERLRQRRLRS